MHMQTCVLTGIRAWLHAQVRAISKAEEKFRKADAKIGERLEAESHQLACMHACTHTHVHASPRT